MTRIPLVFARHGLAASHLPFVGGINMGRIPEGPIAGSIDVDLAAFVIGPEGSASDDGIVRAWLHAGVGKSSYLSRAAIVGRDDFAIAENIKPPHRHGSRLTTGRARRICQGKTIEVEEAGAGRRSRIENGIIERGGARAYCGALRSTQIAGAEAQLAEGTSPARAV